MRILDWYIVRVITSFTFILLIKNRSSGLKLKSKLSGFNRKKGAI